MDRQKTTVIAIVLLLIGLLGGYLFWGNQGKQVASELATVKTRLTEVQQAAVREGAVATKLQQAEAQLKQVTETLKGEQEARQKLEALAATTKKK